MDSPTSQVGDNGLTDPTAIGSPSLYSWWAAPTEPQMHRAGKKCRIVDNVRARLGSEANFGSHKIKISSQEINCIGKIWIHMEETYKLIARNAAGTTQELFTQLIQHDGG